jgi:hypothetical protein
MDILDDAEQADEGLANETIEATGSGIDIEQTRSRVHNLNDTFILDEVAVTEVPNVYA